MATATAPGTATTATGTLSRKLACQLTPSAAWQWARRQRAELGDAYTEVLADRNLLMVMMHGFAAGEDEAIAAPGQALHVRG